MEVDLTKDLYKIGTIDSILNSLYTRNRFTTCTEGIVNISDVPSINISLRECAGKVSLFGGQGYKRCDCKTSCRNNFCSCRKSNRLCNSKYHIIVCHAKTNDIRVGIHHDAFINFFVSLFLPTDVMKNIFLLFFSKEKVQSTTE